MDEADTTPLLEHAEAIVRADLEDWAHALRVAAAVPGGETEMAAWLHDLLEDAPDRWSARQLYDEGFPAEVVEAVVHLTRHPAETYEEYVRRLCLRGSDMALRVKLADLGDNLRRCEHDDEQGLARRYRKAQSAVLAEVLRRWYPG